MTPFLGKYAEIEIQFDNQALGVEADGRLPDNTWENILVAYDVDNPENYAQGVYEILCRIFPSQNITVRPAVLVETEGYFIDSD